MVLGVSYKRDIKDTRESPALDVIKLLEEKGARIEYNDPFVPQIDWNLSTHKSKRLTADRLKKADITIILTDHTQYDYQWIVSNSKLVFDTRNATKKVSKNRGRIDLL